MSKSAPVSHESVRTNDGEGTSPLDDAPDILDTETLRGKEASAAIAQGQGTNSGGHISSLNDLCNLMDAVDLHIQHRRLLLAQDQSADGTNGIPSLDAISMDEEDLYGQQTGDPLAHGQDDACDVVGEFSLPRQICPRVVDRSGISLQDPPLENNRYYQTDLDEEFLQVPIPTFSTGITTFAYQRALRNRIRSGKLARDGDYDTRVFTPTFVHDCLMLPGSLANVLGKVVPKKPVTYDTRRNADYYFKGSAEQIIRRMTPALLPGFHAHVHIETEQPCLIQSDDPNDYAHGMLIFGEGKEGRDQLHQHYRPHAKRIKVEVEFDVAVPVLAEDRRYPQERWVLMRKRQWAHAWLWSNVREFEMQVRMDLEGWRLEDYLAGTYAMHRALRIECQQGEDYDGG